MPGDWHRKGNLIYVSFDWKSLLDTPADTLGSATKLSRRAAEYSIRLVSIAGAPLPRNLWIFYRQGAFLSLMKIHLVDCILIPPVVKIKRRQIKIGKYSSDHLVKIPVSLVKPVQNFRLFESQSAQPVPCCHRCEAPDTRLPQSAVFPFRPLSGCQTAVVIIPIMFQHQFAFRQKNIHFIFSEWLLTGAARAGLPQIIE